MRWIYHEYDTVKRNKYYTHIHTNKEVGWQIHMKYYYMCDDYDDDNDDYNDDDDEKKVIVEQEKQNPSTRM